MNLIKTYIDFLILEIRASTLHSAIIQITRLFINPCHKRYKYIYINIIEILIISPHPLVVWLAQSTPHASLLVPLRHPARLSHVKLCVRRLRPHRASWSSTDAPSRAPWPFVRSRSIKSLRSFLSGSCRFQNWYVSLYNPMASRMSVSRVWLSRLCRRQLKTTSSTYSSTHNYALNTQGASRSWTGTCNLPSALARGTTQRRSDSHL